LCVLPLPKILYDVSPRTFEHINHVIETQVHISHAARSEVRKGACTYISPYTKSATQPNLALSRPAETIPHLVVEVAHGKPIGEAHHKAFKWVRSTNRQVQACKGGKHRGMLRKLDGAGRGGSVAARQ
jgi:hypothetical protein